MAIAANPGDFASMRSPYFKSCQSVCIGTPLKSKEPSAHILPTFLLVKSICHLSLSTHRQRERPRIVRLWEKTVAEPDSRPGSDSESSASRQLGFVPCLSLMSVIQ